MPSATATCASRWSSSSPSPRAFFACGVAASVYGTKDLASGSIMPDAVFSNIGKLLLATKIYDMHRIAHYVSGGLIVALPGPDEDHNPATAASLAAVLGGRPDIPYEKRAEVSRFIEDLTVSSQAGWYSVISLHGGGSPEAMKREIWRNYPDPRQGRTRRAPARPRRARRRQAGVEPAGPLPAPPAARCPSRRRSRACRKRPSKPHPTVFEVLAHLCSDQGNAHALVCASPASSQ